MSRHSAAIRDAIFALLAPLPGYKQIRKTVQRHLQPEETPCITVFRGQEEMAHDGDPNVGEPRFMHAATFHVTVMRGFEDPMVLDGRADDDMDAILETLLCNQGLVAMAEGILSIRKSTSWPQVGDAYYVELRLEITMRYRSFWELIVPNDFLEMAVTGPSGLPQQSIALPGAEP